MFYFVNFFSNHGHSKSCCFFFVFFFLPGRWPSRNIFIVQCIYRKHLHCESLVLVICNLKLIEHSVLLKDLEAWTRSCPFNREPRLYYLKLSECSVPLKEFSEALIRCRSFNMEPRKGTSVCNAVRNSNLCCAPDCAAWRPNK